MSTVAGHRLEEIAQDLLEVMTQISLTTQAHQRKMVELKELEFLTLSILRSRDTMIVGDIQRLLGILPAQMSRIIRSLENRQPALIECHINPRDKRKINVHLTSAGMQALTEYQETRVLKLVDLLADFSEDDQEELSRLVQGLDNLLKEYGVIAHHEFDD